MSDEEKINPGHRKAAKILRIGGLLILAIGLICTGIALFNFAGVMMDMHAGPPRLFWLGFIGLPLMFVGSAMTIFGFADKVARFHAAQYAPVAKDTFNYMAEGTQDGVKTVARSIAEGINEARADVKGDLGKTLRCPACGFAETPDARYCSGCGEPLIDTSHS